MKRLLAWSSALAFLAAVQTPGCVASGTETDNPLSPPGVELRRSSLAYQSSVTVPDADQEALRKGNRDFALDLFRASAAKAGAEENLFLGTYSVSTLLSMTLAGARGITEAELVALLKNGLAPEALHPAMNQLDQRSRGGLQGSGVRYDAFNALWLQKGNQTAAPFLDVLSEQYNTGVFLPDFLGDSEGARQSINAWVSQKTESLIPELFGPGAIDSNTRLALTNAAILSAPWEVAFSPQATAQGEFNLPNGDVVDIPLMGQTSNFPIAFDIDWRAVELPFRGAKWGMVFVLPNPGEFADFEGKLDGATVERIVAGLDSSRQAKTQVWARVPRFSFGSNLDLRPILEDLGLMSAFQQGKADFSGIDPVKNPFVTSFIHQTTVTLDEQGVTAAAATGEILGTKSLSVPFVLNRPFWFFVYDHETSSVIFLGRWVRPVGDAHPPKVPPVTKTDAETICGGLAPCSGRTTTVADCQNALSADSPSVLEQCADCIRLGQDSCLALPTCSQGQSSICQPATCAAYCPAHAF